MFDYHMHSKYSCDGREEIHTLCENAVKQGLKEIVITDHIDLGEAESKFHRVFFEIDEQMLDNIEADIAQANVDFAGKLTVKLGMELGQGHHDIPLMKKLVASRPFDFILASVHDFRPNSPVCIYTKDDPIEVIFPYYIAELTEMVQKVDFDTVGHISYPVRYTYKKNGIYPTTWKPFYEQLEHLFKEIIKRDKGIEINCSGYFQPIGKPLPDLELLTFYKQCGGKILTIGCDAHDGFNVGVSVREGLEVVSQAGFTEITTYTKRVPSFEKI